MNAPLLTGKSLGKRLTGHASYWHFVRSIYLSQYNQVGVEKGFGELVKEMIGARETVWLENSDDSLLWKVVAQRL